MLTLPPNTLGITEFPSIADFVGKWAQLYHGQEPRRWLSLQQDLRRLRVPGIRDEAAVHEWNHAWASQYLAHHTDEKKYYHCPLNIIYAVRDFCQSFIHDQERVVRVWMAFFDSLPAASTVWEYAMADLYTDKYLLTWTLRLLFSDDTGFVRSKPTHPAWEGALNALEGNYFTLTHQTHPNEYLAELVVSEAWWLLEHLCGGAMVEAMKNCGFLPWEGYAHMPKLSSLPIALDTIHFD